MSPGTPSTFVEAVLAAAVPLVMEVKRRSADGTDLMGGRSATDLVRAYEEAGAPCVSVVSGRWFGGDASLVQEVVRSTERPVLQKDFFTRRDQLLAARAAGVSAVLLTAQLLDRGTLAVLVAHALDLGLTPFVEVVSEAEAAAVPCPELCVVAVNNKDIRDQERGAAGVARSERMIGHVLGTGTPLPMSASGIESRDSAAGLLALGYRGLLVGTALLTAGSLDPVEVASWASAT
ncbi:hypothetical protein [Sanguibacter suaedae]|uniref:indole-3-glycerol-phosphate synthase n=1 Tax=Sanguibacter suaedae TaxID=2795737 RepID=A0A934MA12_9MICO|nr:hypothetical protein [Sanguibacter suaedae]MBI9115258.1 hypothetical protein [Sanguibacter suaedae]